MPISAFPIIAASITLAQSPGSPGGRTSTTDVIIVSGALIFAALALGLVALALRKRLLDKGGAAAGGMMLDDLRKMRDRGELSLDEYEAARDAMLGRGGGGGLVPSRPLKRPAAHGGTRVDGAVVAPPGYDLTGRPLPPAPPPPPSRRPPGAGGSGSDAPAG